MEACVRLAREHSVRIGAHPGISGEFGRLPVTLTTDAFCSLVLQQVAALDTIARQSGTGVVHVKLHGALYHAAERENRLATALAAVVGRWFPGVRIIGLAGGRVVAAARAAGVPAWAEGFLDRGYRAEGTLVPRGTPGAVVSEPALIEVRLRNLREGCGIPTVDGRRIEVQAETWCVHADSPGAVRIARMAAQEWFPRAPAGERVSARAPSGSRRPPSRRRRRA